MNKPTMSPRNLRDTSLNRTSFTMGRPNAKGVRTVLLHGTTPVGHVSKPWGRKVPLWAYKPLGGAVSTKPYGTAREAILALSKEL